MSHYLRLSCSALTDVRMPVFKETLHRMNKGYKAVPVGEIKKSSPTFGMDAMLYVDGSPTTIGFKFHQKGKKTALEIGGEFYRNGFDLKEFTRQFCYNYSLTLAEKMVHDNGYRVLKQKVEADGTVHMTVRVAA